MKDKQGREYLKLSEAKEGQIVELDDGFTCHEAGKVELKADVEGKLYFVCSEHMHMIDGQADDGINCVGIYPGEVAQ